MCAVESLSHSLSVIWFPLRNVRNKCECAHTIRVGIVLVVRPYIQYYIYIVTNIQACAKEIKNSLPNLSEGGSLR